MSPSSITVRAVTFWVIAAVIALIAARSAASQVVRGTSISSFAVFGARDGDGLTRRFNREYIRTGGRIPDPARWRNEATRVLARNPLEADAVRIAALSKLASGADIAAVQSLMTLGERVSARDLPTQLWLLENAVIRDDVPGTLQHYDRALSVHPKIRPQLYALLAGALDDAGIRRALAPYVRNDRPWAYEYVGYAVDKTPNTAYVADLLRLSGGSRSVPSQRPLETMMLNKLVAKGQIDVAWGYAQRMASSDVSRSALRDFALSPATMDAELRPFTWSIVEDLTIRTSFNPEDGLNVAAGSGIKAVAADRVMTLRPGRWRFAQRVDLPRLSPMADAAWSATCLTQGASREIWRQTVPQQPGTQTHSATIVIPTDCRATRFRLTVRGAEAQEDSMITIRDIGLVRT